MQNLKISISKSNIKMGAIPSVSLPPVATCSNCSECKNKCYALRMIKRRPSIGQAYQRNLDIFNYSPDIFKQQVIAAAMISNYFRWFTGGDIPNKEFFNMMVDIANTCKNCNFLAFTKNYNVVNEFIANGGTIPPNLKIIFSEWKKAIPNPFNLPKSKVIFRGEQPPTDAKICGGNCYNCICQGIACWTLANNDTIYFYEH